MLEGELREMQALAARIGVERCHLHPGDLAWQRHAFAVAVDWPTELWRASSGELVAWAWLAGASLELAVAPEALERVPDVVAWARRLRGAEPLTATVLDTAPELRTALERCGFATVPSAPFSFHLRCALATLAAPSLPPGYEVRVTRPDELEARVEVHRRAWSVLPFAHGDVEATSSVSVPRYAALARCASYRRELDAVVESASGELLACANGWLDDRNATVELEPVGTVASARGLGLAGAACAQVLRNARALGARHGIVYARGDPIYPRPLRTYAKLGFAAYARTLTLAWGPRRGSAHA